MILTLMLAFAWMLIYAWKGFSLFSPWWFVLLWVMESLVWLFLWILILRNDPGGDGDEL